MINVKRRAVYGILIILFGLYMYTLLRLTVFRGVYADIRAFNLLPLRTVAEYIGFMFTGNRFIGFYNIIGNILLLMPFGFTAAFIYPKTRNIKSILLLSLALSLLIESMQFILATGCADIDDIILNTAGGAAGYVIFKIFVYKRFITE